MIKNIFTQSINREIETVIKADDKLNINTEVKEYVITNEIAEKVAKLFDAYNNAEKINGVWISGFFGSGKSHLLKMLSYVFQNIAVEDGLKAADIFASKVKDDEKLKENILNASQRPAESILFNIDNEANITSKADEKAVLSVFYKVFYNHLGLYGSYPHIAEFELWLYKQDKFEEYKQIYKEQTGLDWIEARRDYFDPDVIEGLENSLSILFNKDASKYEDILDNIESKQEQSPVDFCNKIQDYINSKPKDFRLNFFVDEIGQYIADNTKLMLNLQTIVESLATTTNGRAWVFVTSQSDMESLVGDLSKTQKNDFSKIIGRFRVLINLSSNNVDEVIEKRLLEKKEQYEVELASIYENEKALLKSLISFSDTGLKFKEYTSTTDFVNKYPFVFYQFTLFQNCRIELANHNAFQGKNAAVGERSMLSVFQQVLQEVENKDLNALVSFDLMYKGIENELRPEVTNSIRTAQANLTDEFALKVLKALFLVKYYKQFIPTKRNISVLMIDNIHINIKEHEAKVENALNTLENQSYIQRNGEVYQFLTNDEKDIETEIKNTDIDDPQINNLLKKLFFDEVIRESKLKYLENKQDYEFTQKIDGIIVSREKELEIEIISPNNPDLDNIDILKSQIIGTSTVRLVTDFNKKFMDDVRMFLQIEKYNQLNQSTNNRAEVKRILHEKVVANNERKALLLTEADAILANAKVLINGEIIEVPSRASGRDFAQSAFQSLVKTVYPNLRMLGSVVYTEDTFKKVVNNIPVDELFQTDDIAISEAESEVLTFINRRKRQSERTSLNDLKQNFAKKPYGWYQNALFTVVAKLYKKNKIELTTNERILDDKLVQTAFLKTDQHPVTYIEVETEFDSKQINQLKGIYQDLFLQNTTFSDAKDIAKDFQVKLNDLLQEVIGLLNRKNEIPFVENLQDFKNDLVHLKNQNYAYYLTNGKDFEDAIIDAKEQHFDPIKAFINGTSFTIYNDIKLMVTRHTANISYVDGNEFQILKDFLKEPKPYAGNGLQKAKEAKDTLAKKVIELIEKERNEAIEKFNQAIDNLKQNEFVVQLTQEQLNAILKPFNEKVAELKEERFIGNIRNASSEIRNLSTAALNKAVKLTTPEEPEPVVQPVTKPTTSGEKTVNTGIVAEPKPVITTPKYINRNEIKVQFTKAELSTEQDVKAYVAELEKELLNQIKNNKRIAL